MIHDRIAAAPSEALAAHIARLPVHAPTWVRDFIRFADALDAEKRASRGQAPLPSAPVLR